MIIKKSAKIEENLSKEGSRWNLMTKDLNGMGGSLVKTRVKTIVDN